MKIALIGYGKMGHIIERIAKERGHEVVAIVDVDSQEVFDSPQFASADVAIEFTMPSQAVENYRRAWRVGLPVVSGTTGWNSVLPQIVEEIKQKEATLFWASNFSLGVNIFFELNRHLAAIMNRYPNYDVDMTEVHHVHKKDAPSGTAITLAEEAINILDRKDCWRLAADEVDVHNDNELEITALRENEVPGTHIVNYDSSVDSILIKHEAKSRDGFALGAVVAAEFVVGKKGYFSMRDLLKF